MTEVVEHLPASIKPWVQIPGLPNNNNDDNHAFAYHHQALFELHQSDCLLMNNHQAIVHWTSEVVFEASEFCGDKFYTVVAV
jgi:hypothetical protein